LLWPIILIISILIFRFYNVSFFSPYQRNLYYFALSLPFFSSLGLFYLLKSLKTIIKKELPCKIISFLLITSIIFLAFYSYFSLPQNSQLYETINKDDYKAIKFLSASENGTVLAPVLISDAVFPIAKKQTVGTAYFSGNRAEVDLFFIADNCNIKNQIIKKNNVKYILSPDKINCNWTLIYDNEVFVYKINN